MKMIKLPKHSQPSSQNGQSLLIVVLSLAVVLTIVLSILARSVTDIKISTGSEESLRAFSAAEAGVERALIAGSGIGTTLIGNAQFSASVTKVGEGAKSFVSPAPTFSGETSFFWFVAHDANGNLTCGSGLSCFTGSQLKVCWGKEGTSGSLATTPAIEATIVYATTPGVYSTLRAARTAFDPYDARIASNGFSAPDAGTCSVNGENFAFQKTVDLAALGIGAGVYGSANGLQFLTVRTLYNTTESQPVAISVDFAGNGLLPGQGIVIESSGQSGEANRKINVFQGFGEPPLPFGAVVFSPTGITK